MRENGFEPWRNVTNTLVGIQRFCRRVIPNKGAYIPPTKKTFGVEFLQVELKH